MGTNEIDALDARQRPRSERSHGSVTPAGFAAAEQLLLKLQPLVQSIDDDAESQLEAADLLATNNFSS